jgi:hypothetical protein
MKGSSLNGGPAALRQERKMSPDMGYDRGLFKQAQNDRPGRSAAPQRDANPRAIRITVAATIKIPGTKDQ